MGDKWASMRNAIGLIEMAIIDIAPASLNLGLINDNVRIAIKRHQVKWRRKIMPK